MKYLVLTVAVSSLLWVSCNNSSEKKEETTSMNTTNALTIKVDNAIDPVCEMSTENHVSDTLNYEGKVLGFCSTSCKEKFKKSPKTYLEKI